MNKLEYEAELRALLTTVAALAVDARDNRGLTSQQRLMSVKVMQAYMPRILRGIMFVENMKEPTDDKAT